MLLLLLAKENKLQDSKKRARTAFGLCRPTALDAEEQARFEPPHCIGTQLFALLGHFESSPAREKVETQQREGRMKVVK